MIELCFRVVVGNHVMHTYLQGLYCGDCTAENKLTAVRWHHTENMSEIHLV